MHKETVMGKWGNGAHLSIYEKNVKHLSLKGNID